MTFGAQFAALPLVGQLFDLHEPLSTDILILLLNQPSINIRLLLKSSDSWEVFQGYSLIRPRQVCAIPLNMKIRFLGT